MAYAAQTKEQAFACAGHRAVFPWKGMQELPQREAMSKQDLRNYFLNDLYPLMMALTMVWGDMMSSLIAA